MKHLQPYSSQFKGRPEQVFSFSLQCRRYYVKSAQILASKGDFLPAEWVQEMTPVFFDSMKPHPWAKMEEVTCLLHDKPFVDCPIYIFED